jgi:plastocyanin
MTRRLFTLVLAVGVLVALEGLRPPAAAAGSIRGRVDIRTPESGAEPRPGIADLGTTSTYQRRERRRAVVYLETAPQGAFEEGGSLQATMNQENETFVPHVLAIRVGTVVDFPNKDRIYHNVFSLSKVKRFDLGRYANGQSKSIRFDEPGIVRVFCDIHSHMSAFILVFAHRFFAVTDDQDRYRIERVPAGTYAVAAWYEGSVRQTRAVGVPDDGVVDVDFTVR